VTLPSLFSVVLHNLTSPIFGDFTRITLRPLVPGELFVQLVISVYANPESLPGTFLNTTLNSVELTIELANWTTGGNGTHDLQFAINFQLDGELEGFNITHSKNVTSYTLTSTTTVGGIQVADIVKVDGTETSVATNVEEFVFDTVSISSIFPPFRQLVYNTVIAVSANPGKQPSDNTDAFETLKILVAVIIPITFVLVLLVLFLAVVLHFLYFRREVQRYRLREQEREAALRNEEGGGEGETIRV